MLPGNPPMPVLIYKRRNEYVTALKRADAGDEHGQSEVGGPGLFAMGTLLYEVMPEQLLSAIRPTAPSA